MLVLLYDVPSQGRATATLEAAKVAANNGILFTFHSRQLVAPSRAIVCRRISLARNLDTMAIRITRAEFVQLLCSRSVCHSVVSLLCLYSPLMSLSSASPEEVAELLLSNGLDHVTVDSLLGELTHAWAIMHAMHMNPVVLWF